MSLSNHTLAIVGGDSKTLAAWGITQCVVKVGSQGVGGGDTMEVSVPRGVDEGHLFAAFSQAILRDPDGVRRFVGRLIEIPRSAHGVAQTHVYTFHGPWEYLEGIVYRQGVQIPLNPAVYGSTLTVEPLSMVVLNRDKVTAADISVKEQIEKILDYAMDAGADMDYDSDGLTTLIPFRDEQKDLYCSDALDAQMRFDPAQSAYWDYTTTPPTLRWDDAGAIVNVPITDLRDFEGRPRYDMLIKKWQITYRQAAPLLSVDALQQKVMVSLPHDTSEETNGSLREIHNYVDLGEDQPLPADGLAAKLHEPYKTLKYELSAIKVGQTPDWSIRIGHRWNVTGAHSMWESAKALVQQVTRDIGAGTTTVQAGFPKHLGLDDYLALVRKTREREDSPSESMEADAEERPTPAVVSTTGFQLRNASDDEGAPEGPCLRIYSSTLKDDVPDGFSPGDVPPLYLELDTETGVVFARLTLNSSGEVTGREIVTAEEMPDDNNTEFHTRIGSWATVEGAVVPINDRYGPIAAQICRISYTAAPTYSVTFL